MKHSRTAAGAAAATLAAGLLLGSASTAAAGPQETAQRITTEQELTQSVLAAVALEREGSTEPLAPTSVGRMAVLPC
ncbi:hypothetical protein AB0G20_39575 [Streptomyces sp. NPDC024017]|uniref:hypothetical protein n=1 Tax=Streptomyces sp. NPDC024017 TaxID=3154326 RepID=UPI003405B4AF